MPIQYIPYASLKIKINARRANKQQRETYMVRQTSAAFSIKNSPLSRFRFRISFWPARSARRSLNIALDFFLYGEVFD